MPSISTVAYWEGIMFIGGFFGIVFWKLMTGAIVGAIDEKAKTHRG